MATKKKTAEAAENKLVYIGPSIPMSKLRNGQILAGTAEEINAFIEPLTERYAEIKYLLVTPEEMTDARNKVQQKGNILHKYYQDMAAKAATNRRGAITYA